MFGAVLRVGDLPPRTQAEAAQDRAHVPFDGMLADLQSRGHLAITSPAPNEMCDLLLASRQNRTHRTPAASWKAIVFLPDEQKHRFIHPASHSHRAKGSCRIARVVDPSGALAAPKEQVRASEKRVAFAILAIGSNQSV